MTNDQKPILTIGKICVSVGGREILDLESKPKIEICSGTITAIIGRSGCGKTTLLKHLALLANQASKIDVEYKQEKEKHYKYGGELFKSPERYQLMKNDFSYVFQDYDQNLFDYLNAYDNFTLKLQIKKDSAATDDKILENFFDDFESFKKKYPERLSGGEKQRLAIAQALCSKPRVLFADEPTSANDVNRANTIFKAFQDAATGGTAIVFISHDLQLVKDYANKVLILSPSGTLIEYADLDEMKKNNKDIFTHLLEKINSR